MSPRKTYDPEYQRKWGLMTHYGLTVEEYDTILAAQGGMCAICEGSPGARRLHVDHDHETGRVRGLLCLSCNTLLGNAHDQPSILAAALEYLCQESQTPS